MHLALVVAAQVDHRFEPQSIERGEIPSDCDIDSLSMVSPSMAAYRTMVLQKPVDREFLLDLIDGVILPAVGLRPPY